MFRKYVTAAFVAAALIGIVAEESDAALAKKLGGSGLSGTLSSNRAIRKQQLIADPADGDVSVQGQVDGAPPDAPTRGSTSVRYDASLVTLTDFVLGPGYYGNAFVEVDAGGGRTRLQSFAAFLETPGAVETGYVQVGFDVNPPQGQPPILGTPGQIAIADGYALVDEDGPFGTDTHAFLFDVRDGVSETQVIEYTIYADEGNRPSGNATDFLEGVDADGPFRAAGEISSATVRGSLTAIPLPAAVWLGGVMLIGMWGKRQIGRRA